MDSSTTIAAALAALGQTDGAAEIALYPEQLIESAGWHTSLAQFARTTGLAVTLYDPQGRLTAGPFSPTPLAVRLSEDGAWDPKRGHAVAAERLIARSAIEQSAVVHRHHLDTLALFAVPILLGSRTLGAVVAGWVFDTFPDPVLTDRLASSIGMSYTELWQIVRQQSPVSAEKLATFGEMLSTLTDLFVRERAETLREQEQSRGLRALYQSAQRLAAAGTVDAIGEAALDAVVSLAGASNVRLLVSDGHDWRVAATRGFSDAPPRNGESHRAITSTLRVPVESADGTLLGVIEIGDAERFGDARRRTQISALAAQTAVALHKTNLIEDLDRERERLAQANRAKDLFLATLSHELRTPLTPILNWVAILTESGADDGELLGSGLEAIERCARQELHLVEEMLDLTRILNGKISLEPTAVDPIHALSMALAEASPSARQRNITIRLEAPADVPPILADPGRLQQILGNLISNAIKFTPDGGTITLGARISDDTVDLTVTDTGIGISQEHLPTIFDRFQQVDSTSKRRHGGLGIGLSVVKGLVELHGGSVKVESSIGDGSTFTISMPRGSQEADLATHVDTPGTIELDGRPREGTILIVDDAVDTLVSIAMLLERAGYSVTSAGSATEALDAARTSVPDLIISDLGMPELDGYDLLRLLRQDRKFADTPVIALTGFATLQDREAALAAGFAAHLPKPVDFPVLLRVLDRMMLR